MVTDLVQMAVGVVNASGRPTPAELVGSELGTNEAWVLGVAPAGTQVVRSSTSPQEYTTADTIDEVDGDGAIARSAWDAPEIDGNVYLNGEIGLRPGDRARVTVEASDEYDLWAALAERAAAQTPEPARA